MSSSDQSRHGVDRGNDEQDLKKIVIGLTSYHVNDNARYDIPVEYVNSIRRAGASVVVVPPARDLDVESILSRLDGLVLSGGGDIDPDQYGGETHESVYFLNSERDESELAIAHWAMQKRLPTLAVCRGLQIINVACGGSLHVHIADVFGEKVAHRAPPRNPIDHVHNIESDSRLASVLGETEVTARSWHHQAVDRPAQGFRVVATAPDGCIEAIEHPDRPELLAVQWHPELSADTSAPQQRLFDELVTMAENRLST